MGANLALPQLPGRELLNIGGLRPLPVLTGFSEPASPDAKVAVVGVAGRFAVTLGVQEMR